MNTWYKVFKSDLAYSPAGIGLRETENYVDLESGGSISRVKKNSKLFMYFRDKRRALDYCERNLTIRMESLQFKVSVLSHKRSAVRGELRKC